MNVKNIIKVTNGKLINGNEELECESFSKDTRTIQKGDIYIGIKGEKFDGNQFWKQALDNGAAAVIIQGIEVTEEEKVKYSNKTIILVQDTLKALYEIAKYKRSLYDIPVVAITGSVGKTSTKDMIASVVSTKFKTLKTEGNNNNNIGLPFTILRLKAHEAMVVEMGMNHFGEISFLSGIAKPDTAIIINVGHSHIGNLGSRENILKAKMEIVDGMTNDGTLVINGDNDMLKTVKNTKQKLIKFGFKDANDVTAYNIRVSDNATEFMVKEDEKEYKVKLNLVGENFIYNALAAWVIGKIYGITPEDRVKALANCEFTKMRMNIETKNDIILINDCYNASPESMKVALEALSKQDSKRKIAILGDMRELGEYSDKLHEEVGENVAKNKIDKLYTVGKLAKNIKQGAINEGMDEQNIKSFNTLEELLNELKNLIQKEDAVLVKASRAMSFEKIINELV